MTMMTMPRYVSKHLTIRQDQDEFVKRHAINLSRFLQRKLDEEMEKYGEKEKTR